MRKTLHFKTNTLLKNLVGKDLINDDNIAIIELVKNSYDAGSDEVLVRFTNFSIKGGESTERGQIIISDWGSGMDINDIQDKWLNIAYSDKIQQEMTSGAYLAGNKGIGRFSCDRLGKSLDLLTRKAKKELLHLKIWWPDFEIQGNKDRLIQDVPLEINSISEEQGIKITGMDHFPDTGTVLVISDLRSEWNLERLQELKVSLERFLNPNQLFERNKFRITLSVPSIEKEEENKSYSNRITGEIQNQIFNKLKFNTTYIEAKVFEESDTLSYVLYHEGEKVFDLVEKNNFYQLLKGVHIVIYYLNPYKKAYFKRQTGVRSVDFGSIFLFLNGFRIAPYGDRADDWLGIDVRKTQGTARYLSSRDIVGRIEINSFNEQFTPISSREGLKNTKAFKQLKEVFFLDVLRKLERFVVEGLGWDSVPDTIRQELINSEGLDWEKTSEKYIESWERKKQRIALSIMTLIGSSPDRLVSFWFNPYLLEGVFETRKEEVKILLNDIEKYNPERVDSGLIKNLTRIRTIIDEKEKETRAAKSDASQLRIEVAEKETKINKLEGETETYRAQTLFLQQITSLDLKQLMTYHHQIILDSQILGNYIIKAIKALRNIPNTQGVLEILEKASLANRRMAMVAQYSTKANFRSGTKKELTDIPAFFEQYILNVAKDFIGAGLNMKVSNEVKERFEIKVSRIELSIVIDNLISNAGKAQAHNLNIMITKVANNTLRISFIDDGKGLSKDLPNTDSIFEMGITTTSGSGLGLYHAKNIIEGIEGKISAIPLRPNGMEIRLEVTR